MDSFIILSCQLLLEFLVIVLILFLSLFLLLFEFFFVVKQLVFSLLKTLSHHFIDTKFSFVLLLDHNLYLVIRRKEECLFEDHLRHCPRRCGVQLYLGEEIVYRLYKVLIEVEVIMRHLSRHDKESLTSTLGFQFLGLAVGNQSVLLTMQDESWAEDFRHEGYVLEPFLH